MQTNEVDRFVKALIGSLVGRRFLLSWKYELAGESIGAIMTSMDIPHVEGFTSFRGYRDWYQIWGESTPPDQPPLLCLHGGPGGTHDYLEPLNRIASTGRRVIFYDQLGAGNSDHPHDASLWTVDLFLQEIRELRQALGLDRLHVLGHSWGGMLALEYALTQPPGLASLVIADSTASMSQWVAEANRLRAELPADVQATLLEHEAAGTTHLPAYAEAVAEYYRRHVCRLDPTPDCLNRTVAKMGQAPQVYATMNGPSEFFITGTLKDWTVQDRLGQIHVPTLVIGGRYDEATPEITGTIHRGIPRSEWLIFENSSHMPHLEETEPYLRQLEQFLDRADRRGD